jgi:ATP-dependent DNA helicase RecQ
VDKKNIRTVIHYDIPGSVEAYLQESGRAGRDGLPSLAVALFSEEDKQLGARISRVEDRARYSSMLSYAEDPGCRRVRLLKMLGYEAEGCSGCDRCDGTHIEVPEDQDRILAFVRRNRRRFTQGQTSLILAGGKSYKTRRQGLMHVPGFGLLSDWSPDEIEEALTMLLIKKILRMGRGPWRKRLTAPYHFSLPLKK